MLITGCQIFILLLRNNQYMSSSDCSLENLCTRSRLPTKTKKLLIQWFFSYKHKKMKGEGGRPSTIICKILIFLYLTTLFISIIGVSSFLLLTSFAQNRDLASRNSHNSRHHWSRDLFRRQNIHWIQGHRSKGSTFWGTNMLVHWRLSTSSSLIRCTRSFCYVTVRNLTGFLTASLKQRLQHVTDFLEFSRLSILSITSSLIQTKSRWLLFCQWTTFSDLDKFSDQDLRVLAVIVLGELRGLATNKWMTGSL